MPKKKPAKLIPPDTNQCQAMFLSGCFPDAAHFMSIGPGKLERCKNKPTVIATERRKGKDGLKGSMSLCENCLHRLWNLFGVNHVTVKKIK